MTTGVWGVGYNCWDKLICLRYSYRIEAVLG